MVVSSTIRLNVRCCHGSQCIRGGQRGAELVCSAAADLWLSGCKLQPLSQLPAAAAAGGLLAAGPELLRPRHPPVTTCTMADKIQVRGFNRVKR